MMSSTAWSWNWVLLALVQLKVAVVMMKVAMCSVDSVWAHCLMFGGKWIVFLLLMAESGLWWLLWWLYEPEAMNLNLALKPKE